ncbi:2836_t:CDS:1 [Paraglomus occultum]|uniref:Succinate dehydrogenase assembly factor 3 n=1 Tax=Paraglomus occultum TaxID=144539 RepID=A0A9N8VXR2_9GLOM|nr:2836_t:CDS:1 [Paraglomus occultum]
MSAARPLFNSSSSLLSPISLYRRILRIHRALPPLQRSLGDDYVKSEFHRHKDIVNPVHVVGFLGQWQTYLEELERQATNKDNWGKPISEDLLDKFSDEQIGQLCALKSEATSNINQEKESESENLQTREVENMVR